LHYVSRALPSMSRGGPVTVDSGASPTAWPSSAKFDGQARGSAVFEYLVEL
jgi:hypothetical protein